jgi:hypothetical protein
LRRTLTKFELEKHNFCMKHTLSFPKSALEVPKIRLEIGIDTEGRPYTGILVSRLPPNGDARRFPIPEPAEE